MTDPSGASVHPSLERLAWDSEFFGFPVARITPANVNDAELLQVLRSARDNSISLLYWFTSPDRQLAPSITSEFNGLLADQKVTFELNLPLSAPSKPRQ